MARIPARWSSTWSSVRVWRPAESERKYCWYPSRLGDLPDLLDDLGRAGQGIAFLVELEIGIGDQIVQHGKPGRRARRRVRRVPARADQHVVRLLAEVAVVLAVHEQQIHAEAGRRLLQGIGHGEQDRDAGRAVVRARAPGAFGSVEFGPSEIGRVSQCAR